MSVFSFALRKSACNIVLLHDHPSGDLISSDKDSGILRERGETVVGPSIHWVRWGVSSDSGLPTCFWFTNRKFAVY